MEISFRDLIVFTRDGAGGNPLAVIDFDSVASSRWQETATAVGYSESVFVEKDKVATVHIYTPARRIPFAGHPLVGTAFALGSDTELIRYDTGVAHVQHGEGEVSVTVTSAGAITETLPPAFGVSARLVEMPLTYLVVEAPDVETVAALGLADVEGLDEVYVWAWETAGEVVHARFFAPGVGVEEDAATGSGAVAFARAMTDEQGSLVIHQGEEIGRPSLIRLEWDGTEVSIGGMVIDLGLSTIDLD